MEEKDWLLNLDTFENSNIDGFDKMFRVKNYGDYGSIIKHIKIVDNYRIYLTEVMKKDIFGEKIIGIFYKIRIKKDDFVFTSRVKINSSKISLDSVLTIVDLKNKELFNDIKNQF